MTEDSDLFADRVRRSLEAVADATEVRDDWGDIERRVAAVDPGPRSGRSRTRLGVAAAAVFVVVVVGAAALVWHGWVDELAVVGDGSSRAPAVESSPVRLWISAERAPAGSSVELVAVLVDDEGVDATFGLEASIDRWDGGAWVPHRRLVMCLPESRCTAVPHGLGDPMGVDDIGLSAAPGQPGPAQRFSTEGLDVGWYRVAQRSNEGVVAAGRFEVADDASPTAPLEPVDRPGLSVSPVLVSPVVGAVRLEPLVSPDADGNLTAEDIEAAVEGLSETATIERWDGRRWVATAEVELAPDEWPSARTAQLPELQDGAYRLVRTRASEEHAGNFWVTDEVNPAAADRATEPTHGSAVESGFVTAGPNGVVLTGSDGDLVEVTSEPAAVAYAVGTEFVVWIAADSSNGWVPMRASGPVMLWNGSESAALQTGDGVQFSQLLDAGIVGGRPTAVVAEVRGSSPFDTIETLVAIDLATQERTIVVERPAWESTHVEARILSDGDVLGLVQESVTLVLNRWTQGEQEPTWSREVGIDTRLSVAVRDEQASVIHVSWDSADGLIITVDHVDLGTGAPGTTTSVTPGADPSGTVAVCGDWLTDSTLVCSGSEGPPLLINLDGSVTPLDAPDGVVLTLAR